MCLPARRAPSLKSLVAVLLLASAISVSGCTGNKSRRDPGEAVDEYFTQTPGARRLTLGKFEGRVLIDGLPPEKGGDYKLFVLLNDPEHPQKLPTTFTQVMDDGTFGFMTYLARDGVPVGKYVVEFAYLHLRHQRSRQGFGVPRIYVGPDRLNNLYNDPEKNREHKEFLVEVTQPGRSDYEFNLSVAGRPVAEAGPYSATMIPGL